MSNEIIIWRYLKAKGLNDYATAGLMGNLYAESMLKSNNLENSKARKLGMSDETYTRSVDDGTYDDFAHDGAGYGIAQWTHWSRKEKLLKHANEAGKSIGDINTQLDYLWQEITTMFPKTIKGLREAQTIKAASNIVLTDFERPANQGESVKAKRLQYSEDIYERQVKI